MAHERTELELGPGVNALTGPNNTGKSAIVEALRCVATNPVPKHYIRHGAKEARVTVEVEDGTKVVWVRKKRSSGYELWPPGAEEPEEYWKFGRKPPEDILAVLRLNLVELEGDKEPIDVHIGNQRDPVFLLNQPKSDAAAFFAASTESAHLLAMQNLLKRKTMDAKRQKKDLDERTDSVEDRLDLFSPLPDIEMELETARELESAAKNYKDAIPALENLLRAQVEMECMLRDQSARMAVLQSLEKAPTVENTANLSAFIHQITTVKAAFSHSEKQVQVLGGLTTVPATEDTRRLASLCNEMQAMEIALAQGTRRAEITADLVSPPAAEDVRYLAGIIDELLAAKVRLKRENRRLGVMDDMPLPPELENLNHLQAVIGEVAACHNQMEEAKSVLNQLEMRLEMLEKDIGKRLDELGHCPTCGTELNGVEFLDRGGRHDA